MAQAELPKTESLALLLGQHIVISSEGKQQLSGEIFYFSEGVVVLRSPASGGFRLCMVNLDGYDQYLITTAQSEAALEPQDVELGALLSE